MAAIFALTAPACYANSVFVTRGDDTHNPGVICVMQLPRRPRAIASTWRR